MTSRQGEASDELVLVRAAQLGDPDAFAMLVRAHRPWLVGLCRSLLTGDHDGAEDVAQECLVRLHSALVRCPDRELAVRPWLSVVARHACIDHFRRAQRQPVPVDDLPEHSSHDEDIFEVDPALAKAWGRLTPRHREALYHRELIGLSYEDIATLLQTTSAGVESLLVRARAALRREYRRAGGRLLGCGAFLGLERSVRGENPHPEAVAHVARCRSCAEVVNEIELTAGLLRGVPQPPAPLPSKPWSMLHDTRIGDWLAPVVPLASDLSHLAVAASLGLAVLAPMGTAEPASRPAARPTVGPGMQRPVPAPLPAPDSTFFSAELFPSPAPAASPAHARWRNQDPSQLPQPSWPPMQNAAPTPTAWSTTPPLAVPSSQPDSPHTPAPTWNPWSGGSEPDFPSS